MEKLQSRNTPSDASSKSESIEKKDETSDPTEDDAFNEINEIIKKRSGNNANRLGTSSFSLVDRELLYLPTPVYLCEQGGKIVININVNAKGEVLGVSIAPGLKTAVHSLFSKTAQLPEVPLEIPAKAIGTNTLHSIQSGVLYGYEGLVKKLLGSFKNELLTECKVLATGGLSSILPELKKEFDEVDVNLTLNGLRIIGEGQY